MRSLVPRIHVCCLPHPPAPSSRWSAAADPAAHRLSAAPLVPLLRALATVRARQRARANKPACLPARPPFRPGCEFRVLLLPSAGRRCPRTRFRAASWPCCMIRTRWKPPGEGPATRPPQQLPARCNNPPRRAPASPRFRRACSTASFPLRRRLSQRRTCARAADTRRLWRISRARRCIWFPSSMVGHHPIPFAECPFLPHPPSPAHPRPSWP